MQLVHGTCAWGRGTLEAYIRGVDARLGLEEESDAPFVADVCCDHQGCVIVVLWRVKSDDVKGDDTGARGRAARPVRRGGVCQAPRVGGAAAKPTPRRAVQRGWCGETAPCRAMPRWRKRSSRGRDGARGHARHMRRRTSGLRQLTLPPRSISRLSSASSPSYAAFHNFNFLSFEGKNQSICSPRVSGARGSADEFPDTQSERNRQTFESPKVRSSHAPRGTAELASRANSMLDEG
jgi:hypothetical protein